MKTVRSGRELSIALKKATERTGKDYSFVIKKLTMDAFRELVDRSARDTGFLRSNWAVTTGVAHNDELKNPGGSFVDASPPAVDPEVGDKVILYNNTEYVMSLETGTSRMRAQPMIEPTYQHIIRVASQLVKALSKKRYKDV